MACAKLMLRVASCVMMPKTKQVTLKATQTRGATITQNHHFAMVELTALEGLSDLIARAPMAARLIVTLIRRMSPGSGGVVVVSRQAMCELLECSMPTVERALRLLINEGWVQRMRIGSAHALAINSRIAWAGPRGQLSHAVFDATVIASRSEQDAIALDPPPMRPVPVIHQGETAIPIGDGSDPPSQQLLGGVGGPVATTADTGLGDEEHRRTELEKHDQQRLTE